MLLTFFLLECGKSRNTKHQSLKKMILYQYRWKLVYNMFAQMAAHFTNFKLSLQRFCKVLKRLKLSSKFLKTCSTVFHFYQVFKINLFSLPKQLQTLPLISLSVPANRVNKVPFSKTFRSGVESTLEYFVNLRSTSQCSSVSNFVVNTKDVM